MIYVDSSVLLTVYLGQPRAAEAARILAQQTPLVASWLLAVEVPVVLRRALRDEVALAAALDRFDGDAAAISLVHRLPEVALRVRHNPRLSRCRALDAIHAATALLLAERTGHPVRMATFDRRLAELAAALDLELIVSS